MKKAFKFLVIGVVLALLVLWYFWYLSNRTPDGGETKVDKAEMTETDQILAKDFSKTYPETPRGVVKWYNRIITEYYAEDHTDDQVKGLSDQARALFDDELLAANPAESFYTNVKADISSWKDRDAKLVTTKVCSSNDVRYAETDGEDLAYVTSYYCVLQGTDLVKSYQEFCLRKDGDGRWKILTWRLTDGDEEDYT